MQSFILFSIKPLFIAAQNPEHDQANLQTVWMFHSLDAFVTALQSCSSIVQLNITLKYTAELCLKEKKVRNPSLELPFVSQYHYE